MLSRSFTQKELQMNQTKHKQLLLQIHFATLKSDNRTEHVLFFGQT